MANNQDNIASARSYAEALLELAESRGALDVVASEMQAVSEAFTTGTTFRQYIADPSIPMHERAELIDKAFGGQVSPLVVNFLKLVNAKGKLSTVPAIAEALDVLLDEKHGKIEVGLTVPEALPAPELEAVRQRVSVALKKDAVVHQYIDPSLIGGLILQVGDQRIDGSVKAQLETLRRKLVASTPS